MEIREILLSLASAPCKWGRSLTIFPACSNVLGSVEKHFILLPGMRHHAGNFVFLGMGILTRIFLALVVFIGLTIAIIIQGSEPIFQNWLFFCMGIGGGMGLRQFFEKYWL